MKDTIDNLGRLLGPSQDTTKRVTPKKGQEVRTKKEGTVLEKSNTKLPDGVMIKDASGKMVPYKGRGYTPKETAPRFKK